ncbi:MAG: response regulator [Candidatus Omnitrophica bacterium]|nr:response regulator [Candidatus Omnitrophota bacterium]
MKIKILVVDDQEIQRVEIQTLLEAKNFEVFVAKSAEQGLEIFDLQTPDVIISDISMPGGMDGLELLEKIKNMSPETQVILLTGYGDIKSAISALKKGASDYLIKPVNFDALLLNISRALENQKIYRQLKTQEVQLLRAAKLTAMGELSAGVAHEMNQPLMAISSHIEGLLLQDEFTQNLILKNKMIKIKDQFVRLGTIVKRMHEYSGQRIGGFAEGDVKRPISDGIFLLTQQFKDHNINVILELEENLPALYIDRYQIQDVVVNFLVNARDAVDEKFNQQEGGQIRVLARKMKDFPAILAGIIDNGIAVKSGSEENLFDPFFTTKAPGKGTGLGLSVSSTIIRNHKGTIGFVSLKNERKFFYFALALDRDKDLNNDAAFHKALIEELGIL